MKVALLHYTGDECALSDACADVVGVDVLDHRFSDSASLITLLESDSYIGLCLGWRGAVSVDLVDAIRSSAKLIEFPIIGLFNDGWSTHVDHAFCAGIDDLCEKNYVKGIRSRLIALGDESGHSPEQTKQKVYVFDTDRRRRALFARFLRRMGLDIVFAEQSDELFGNRDISLVVASAPSVDEQLAKQIADSSQTKWLMTGSAKQILDLPPKLLLEDHVSFFNIDNDIAQIVFVANELLIGTDVSQKRASTRLQHGTSVRYKSIDADLGANQHGLTQEHFAIDSSGDVAAPFKDHAFGYTYNLSRGGVFVRSFAPPPTGTNLELEFQAPTGRGRSVILGTVVWRQSRSVSGAATPRGFGFQYHERGQAGPDMAALETGYNALYARFRRSSDVV